MSHLFPFLPSSVNLPYVGVISGDGVTYGFLALLVLVLLLLFTLIGIIRGSGSRARMAAELLGGATATRGITTGSAASITTSADAGGVRRQAEVMGSLAYRTAMAQIGTYLATADAQHVCVSEVEGGYLLIYNTQKGLVVETLTPDDVAKLPPPPPSGLRTPPPRPLQQGFQQIGRFLDQQFAISVLVAQQQAGFYVEYAAPPLGTQSAAKLVRVSRLLDDDALARMAGR